jgi:signal peptidase I|tara:strand:+ start:39 stop:539 length:501 start_codon:yes stop_codon:yes gene_type:complete
MLKTVGRLINLKTIFFVILYVILKRENKSFTTYEIKEESMSPELLPEDYVLAIKTNEPLSRGDIVIFKNSEKSIDVVKRVVGLPGETISASNNELLVNGKTIEDPWAKTVTDDFIDCNVGENEVFVLGDQRRLSTSDSRTLGTINATDCLKLKYRYWPYQRIKAYE